MRARRSRKIQPLEFGGILGARLGRGWPEGVGFGYYRCVDLMASPMPPLVIDEASWRFGCRGSLRSPRTGLKQRYYHCSGGSGGFEAHLSEPRFRLRLQLLLKFSS